MPKPKKVYFLEVVRGTGSNLGYGQRGGGHFTSEKAARERKEYIAKRGVESILWETDVDWREIE